MPVRSRRPTRGPRHNQVPVQPNEHHALDLTGKYVAAQVINGMGEDLKIALGLTAVLDVGGHDRCSRPSLGAL